MKPSKKEIEAAKTAAKKYENDSIKSKASKKELDNIWNAIEEMQANLDFINDKLVRIMERMGIE